MLPDDRDQLDELTTHEGVAPIKQDVVLDDRKKFQHIYYYFRLGREGLPSKHYIEKIVDGLKQHDYDQRIVLQIIRIAGYDENVVVT